MKSNINNRVQKVKGQGRQAHGGPSFSVEHVKICL